MLDNIDTLINHIQNKGLTLDVNLERPIYVQPEDRISYRSFRILIIIGMLDAQTGLSKEVVASLDFLLRNKGYQKEFVLQYFRGKQYIIKKVAQFNINYIVENDRNIVQYKSVPWDLRFNDMFMFLHVRGLVEFLGNKPTLRVRLSEKGKEVFENIKEVFPEELNFLELFGKRLSEEKTIKIITEVIPNSYWTDNEKFSNK
jgi:hypothetical protein